MATPIKKRFKVWEGNSYRTCYPYTYPGGGKSGWRFNWRKDQTEKWRGIFKDTKEEITEAARKNLIECATGEIIWTALPGSRRDFLAQVHRESSIADQEAILQFIKDRQKSGLIKDAVQRFVAYKITAKNGVETEHLATVRRDLENLAERHGELAVIDITIDQLTSWWHDRTGTAGPARRAGIRTNVIGFFNWCQKDGIAGSGRYHTAHRLPPIDPGEGQLQIFTLEQFEFYLSIIEKEWLPMAIMGAFQGVRPEELAPKKKRGKSRLQWEHLNWDFESVGLPKKVAKGGKKARVFQMHEVTAAWLKAYGVDETWTGHICPANPSEVQIGKKRLTKIWGEKLKERFPEDFPDGWPKDVLRHSYASYRNGIIQNLNTVALEMGTSEGELHGHYNNPRTLAQGEAWFAFTPDKLGLKLPYLKAA
jgi:integrase